MSELYAQHQPKSQQAWEAVVNAQNWNVEAATEYTLSKQHEFGCSYTEQQLRDYIYQLFVPQTYGGMSKEERALAYLQRRFPDLQMKRVPDYDTTYAVDICLMRQTLVARNMVCGIQVKPTSYREEDKPFNEAKNRRFTEKFKARPAVHYLLYDSRGWVNMKEVEEAIITSLAVFD